MKWLQTITTVPPAVEPVSLAEMKAHLHVDASYTADDGKITPLIKSARAHVEKLTGTRLVTQTVIMRADRFCPEIRLPVGPIASITTLNYIDTAGAEQTVSTDVYRADLVGLEPVLSLKPGQSWPSTLDAPAAVKITAIAGTAADAVDPSLALAIKLTVEGLYDEAKPADATMIENLLINCRRSI